MHARRAAWADEEPLESALPPVFTAPPSAFADAPVFTAQAPPLEDPVGPDPFDFDDAAVYEAEPVVTKPAAEPPFQRQLPTVERRSLAESIVSAAARMSPGAPAMKVAAVVAVVAVGGWLASSYVGNVKTWLTELTDKATSSKPEPTPAKPARPPVARRTGQLTAKSEPAGARVLVDGRERGVTPLTIEDVPFGSHTVVIKSDKGSVQRTVKIAADRDAVVSESIFAGWLTVFAPFEVQITEGTSAVRLDESGKVLLSAGPHDLRFENRDVGYRESRRVEILPGETTSLSLVASPSTLTVTASAPAVVLIDGQQVGETPLTNHPISLGTRDIVVRGADGTERRFTRRVTAAPVQIDVDFSKP